MGIQFSSKITNGAQLDLINALLIYGSDQNQTVATIHPIDATGARPEIGAGRLLHDVELATIAQSLLGGSLSSGFLSDRILAVDHQSVTWWRPAGVRPMFLSGSGASKVGKASITVPHPPLVFRAANRRLRIFALKKNKRPDPETELMCAPYPNVYSGGALCIGNADAPNRAGPDNTDAWERMWDESNFTHSNSGETRMTSFKGGIHALWKHLDETAPKTFSARYLVKAGGTVAGLINHPSDRL